jgi:hypothetical protein
LTAGTIQPGVPAGTILVPGVQTAGGGPAIIPE